MIEIYNRAEEIPNGWNEILEDNQALGKENLAILEECNPCSQKYVVFKKQDKIDSLLVSYRLNLNIFSYTKFSLKLPMTIIGIPCSVSSRGYVLGDETKDEFIEYISSIRGAKMIINAEDGLELGAFFKGHTLPACKMNMRWKSFEEWLQSLRSHYRYRFNIAIKKFRGITVKKLVDNSCFTREMYMMYEQVFNKSNYKLEKLTIDFFQNFPGDIYVFYEKNNPIAFVQLKQTENKLIFLFGGLEYRLNKEYDIYINMLLFILKTGIDAKVSTIDMGQTAEDAKVKLGCELENKFMYVSHSNHFIAWIVKKFGKSLSYNVPVFDFNLFKEKL